MGGMISHHEVLHPDGHADVDRLSAIDPYDEKLVVGDGVHSDRVTTCLCPGKRLTGEKRAFFLLDSRQTE